MHIIKIYLVTHKYIKKSFLELLPPLVYGRGPRLIWAVPPPLELCVAGFSAFVLATFLASVKLL